MPDTIFLALVAPTLTAIGLWSTASKLEWEDSTRIGVTAGSAAAAGFVICLILIALRPRGSNPAVNQRQLPESRGREARDVPQG